MEIIIKKTNEKINLTKNNFVSSGGEGKIFAKNGVAYKIYDNEKNIIPFSKIKELKDISDPNVIKPENILINKTGKKVGYSMRYVSNTYLLCQIFAKSFRDRHNISNETILNLIQKMQSTIKHIHSKGILIVDLNEMNFLIDKSFKEIYFIDVDSYQTCNFPATAIMESIRDWNSPVFNQLTDWFSFGVISFHMFCLIHPFKGKHPKIKGMKDRMLANIPVFHKDVKFPKVCLPFDVIPQAYKEWYKALFFEGKRLPPPSGNIQTVIMPVMVQTITSNEDFDISEMFEYNSNVIKFLSVNGTRIIVAKNGIYLNTSLVNKDIGNAHIAITPLTNQVIATNIKNGYLVFSNIAGGNSPAGQISAEDIMSYKGRVFIKNKDIVSELEFVEMGKNVHIVPRLVANIMESATKLFEGVVIQNVLGSFIASIFPTSGEHYQVQCPEFKGYQIIDAKYDSNVLFVIGGKNGKYDKFILRFDEKFLTYSIRKVDDISYSGINFTVLENGIVVHINNNEEIEIFSSKKDAATVKVIDSPVISGDMRLFRDGVKVVFAKGKKMYRLKMK